MVDVFPPILNYTKKQLFKLLNDAYKAKDTDLIIQARWQLKRKYNTEIRLGRDSWTIVKALPEVAQPKPWPTKVVDNIMKKIYGI